MPPPPLFSPPLPIPSRRTPRPPSPARRPRALLAAARPPSPHVVIIGGGAAGHLAAISLNTHARIATTILESSSRVLHKVRISGGGRCNVASANDAHDLRAYAARYPRGARRLLSSLSAFGPADARAFFEALGVPLKVEPGGKVFPVSDTSRTVVDALARAARDAGVSVALRARVARVDPRPGGYAVALADGPLLRASHVVVATGGAPAGRAIAAALGHRVVPPVPSLFTFAIDDSRLAGLAGLSVSDVCVTLDVPRSRDDNLAQRGALLVTHWGLSGPAVLSLSAFSARVMHERRYRVACVLDWVPTYSQAEKTEVLKAARKSLAGKNVATVCPFRQLPRRLWRRLVAQCGDLKWGSLSNGGVGEIVDVLQQTRFVVKGKGEFKDEFVTAGGVALNDVNMKTFESKICPRLYFAGEALDVDGQTGGYNLGFAWSSGYIAGSAIADDVLRTRAECEPVLSET